MQMVVQLSDTCLGCQGNMKPKEMERFVQKFHALSKDEVAVALMVTNKEILSMLTQMVPCVGCRRRWVTFQDLCGVSCYHVITSHMDFLCVCVQCWKALQSAGRDGSPCTGATSGHAEWGAFYQAWLSLWPQSHLCPVLCAWVRQYSCVESAVNEFLCESSPVADPG